MISNFCLPGILVSRNVNWVKGDAPLHRLCLIITLNPFLHALEGVKTYVLDFTGLTVFTSSFFLHAIPSQLQQQVVRVDFAHPYFVEASSKPCIFLRVFLHEVIAHAFLVVIDPECMLREDFDWPMKAKIAIVKPHCRARVAL